jgi:hypothetical protein
MRRGGAKGTALTPQAQPRAVAIGAEGVVELNDFSEELFLFLLTHHITVTIVTRASH